MKGKTLLWIALAIILLVAGLAASAIGFAAVDWDLAMLGSSKYNTVTLLPEGEFSDIYIDVDTTDVVFLPSEDEKTKIVAHEMEKMTHTAEIKDGRLSVGVVDRSEWYDRIFNFGSPSVTVYLPEVKYENLTIKSSTGDIRIPKELAFTAIDVDGNTGDVGCYASADSIKIKTTTGDIRLSYVSAGSTELFVSTGDVFVRNLATAGILKITTGTGDTMLDSVTCGELLTEGSTGDLSMRDVIATGRFTIERDTGDVEFYTCDAAEIYIQTSTGDVEGSLLSGKSFFHHTSTGDVDLPYGSTGGRCEIKTSTGDIEIDIVIN